MVYETFRKHNLATATTAKPSFSEWAQLEGIEQTSEGGEDSSGDEEEDKDGTDEAGSRECMVCFFPFNSAAIVFTIST